MSKDGFMIPAGDRQPNLVVPDSDYVLTLDADSVLLPEYCLRLVYFMEQRENERVAVVQTPYSAYRGKVSRVERVAGGTTDIQHIVHQGLTRYGATFWVGANAVIRKPALDELCVEDDGPGFSALRQRIQTSMDEPDMILAVHRHARHRSKNPVIRQRLRPERFNLKGRHAGLRSRGGRGLCRCLIDGRGSLSDSSR